MPAALLAAVLFFAQGGSASLAAMAPPTCGAARATPAVTEGPYYKRGAPAKSSLIEPGMPGTKITVTGYVLSTRCRPIAGASLDVWQANDRGEYDTAGYRLRGRVTTDQAGAYAFQTILPGQYPGRTRHIHVKVSVPNGPTLTTQLFFPGEPGNQTDGIFDPNLVVSMREGAAGRVAVFNFFVDAR